MKNLLQNLKKYINMKKFAIFVLIFFSVTTILFFDNLLGKDLKDGSKITYLDDSWDVTLNDEVYEENASVDDILFKSLDVGDIIELKTTLMSDWDYEQACMCLSTKQSALEIYVADEKVYEYGHDRIADNQCVGSGLLYVNMLDEYKGKELKIVITVAEKSAFSRLDDIWYAEWNDAYRYVVTENRLAMFLGFFCIIFGVIVLCISIFALIFAYEYVNVIYLALFSICLGIWSLCNYNCITIFAIPLNSKTLMEYFTLMLSPVLLIIYIKDYVLDMKNKINKIIYTWTLTIHMNFIIFVAIVHTLRIIHVTTLLPLIYLILGFEVLFLLRVMIINIRNRTDGKFTIAGLFIIIALVGYDSAVYLADRYLGAELLSFPGLSTLGVIIFTVILIIDLYKDVIAKKMEKHEKELLIKRAYTDDLTQMNNRRYCSEYMSKIMHENTEYAIMSFDLNGLKQTNDMLGHSKGDILIKKAADVITEAFGSDGVVGRMGGDEFIAIFKFADQDKIQKLISKFYGIIDNVNKKEKELNLSISLGYALSTESDNCDNFEVIYNMADNRMYENKKKIKKEMKKDK